MQHMPSRIHLQLPLSCSLACREGQS